MDMAGAADIAAVDGFWRMVIFLKSLAGILCRHGGSHKLEAVERSFFTSKTRAVRADFPA